MRGAPPPAHSGDLADALSAGAVFHLRADVGHRRLGAKPHSFAYRVDYLLLAPEIVTRGRGLFSRNRFNLFALHDRDHGGTRGAGIGAPWARAQFAKAGIAGAESGTLALLTQPRFLGFGFNPVSFWCLFVGGALRAVIAEVNNTFGDRHSYLCFAGGAPLTADQTVEAKKIFHVSPFQDIGGTYRFRFDLDRDSVVIRIAFENGGEGLLARLAATPRPLSQPRLLTAAAARPGGALRVVALIFWHALRLKLRGIAYRPRPTPPIKDISS